MDYYFTYSKIFLSTLGQWPYQSRLIAKICQYFWTMQHISIMIPEAIKLYEYRKNIDLVIECLPNLLYNAGIGVKFINGVINQHKIKLALEKVKQDWNKVQNNHEQIKILQDFSDSGRLLIIFYIGFVYFVLLSFMFIPLSPIILDFINPLNETRPKSPLYIAEFFVDQDKYYYSILMHGYVTSLFGILPLFGNDIFLSNCVHHACGMFTILGHRLKKQLSKENVDGDEIYKQTIDCVVQHQRIIEFCDDVNKIYSTSFFFVLTICIIMMSVTGVVAVIKLEENFKDCFRFAMFTIAQIFHMLCYNLLGQKLLNQGEKFSNYIWESNWYLASRKTKFIIQFIVFRSSKPANLQANIFPLSLENFTSVMKTSMSYFTVFKSTR
ncbi:odorant receptor 13a-like [Phymastichus coffea]|uniref:odorant receptor 13a-like n=1 Tax=Phymastichus coffea TaxID=108790 RepID=UPI00273BFA87|nr:odorant receptor 13a-like [Phymastichus coffea]